MQAGLHHPRMKTGSCTQGLRRIFQHLSHAVCAVSISRHEPSKRVFLTSFSPVDLIASAPVLPCLMIIILVFPLPHLELWPRRHAQEQYFTESPPMARQSRCHRWRTRAPLLG